MIRKLLCASALVGVMAGTEASWGQDAAPKVEATKDAAPAAAGGGIYGDFNMALPDEAIGLIAKQAGVELVVQGNAIWTNAEPITLKVDDGYFWPTFMEMCKQAKISYMPEPGLGRNRVRLMDARGGDPFAGVPQSVSKGFVVLAQSATRTYSVFYAKAVVPPRNSLRLQMQILVDPLTPVASWDAPTVTEAVDENGATLVPGADARSGTLIRSGNLLGLSQPITIDLAENASVGKKIASLKGTLNGTAVVKTEKADFDLPLPADGKTIKTPDYDVVLTSPNPGAAFMLSVRFVGHQPDAAPAAKGAPRRAAPLAQMNLLNGLVVLDAQGNSIVSRPSFSSDAQGNVSATISTMGGRGGEPTKLSWKVPVATKPIQIPFEFKDLAIP